MRVSTVRRFTVFLLVLAALLALQIPSVHANEDKAVQEVDAAEKKNATLVSKDNQKEGETSVNNEKEATVATQENQPEVEEEEDSDEDLDDHTIELNPNYVEEESDSDDENDEYDSEEEEQEDAIPKKKESKRSAKSQFNSKLAEKKSLLGRRGKKCINLVKHHRIKITVAMALFAFRNEIFEFVLNQVAPISKDPKTGKNVRSLKTPSMTSAIKIIVFVDVMRQLQAAGKKKQSPLLAALLLLAAKNPVLGTFIMKTILNENSSYVPPTEQHYTFEKLNDRYFKDCLALEKAADFKKKQPSDFPLSPLPILQDLHKAKHYNETVIVLDLTKLESGLRMEVLRDEVSFIIQQHRQSTIVPYGSIDKQGRNKTHEVEVLVLLESPGGSASDFALASQHILRLRKEPGIQVTVCVDKIAASGGYMIACAATPGRLFAAPFAVVGSIGVIGQIINVQKTLEGWGMRPMVFRSGKDKSPINPIGDVSSRDMKRIQTMIDETHVAFKRHVAHARPSLAETIDNLATGKVWLAYDGLELNLVDRIITSDEYIAERIKDGAKLLKLIRNPRKPSLFGGSRRRIDEPFTGITSHLLAPFKDHLREALVTFAKNANMDMNQGLDETSLAFKAAGVGQVMARADSTAYSTSSYSA